MNCDLCLCFSRFIVTVLTVATCASFGIQAAPLSARGQQLADECSEALSLRRYEEIVGKAETLRRLGNAEDNETEALIGETYALCAAINLRDTADISARVEALVPAMKDAEDAKDWKLAALLASTVALYNHFVLSDFSQAAFYSSKQLQYARNDKNRIEEAKAMSSFASIYFSKRDESGLKYAIRSYGIAKETGDKAIIYVTACNMANYLYNLNKPTEALAYLQEGESVARQLRMDNETVYINSFFGDIEQALGHTRKAEEYYRLAVADQGPSSRYDKIYAHICYGNFLKQNNRMVEALAVFKQAEAMSEKYDIVIFRADILQALSSLEEQLGNYSAALAYHKQYVEAYSRVVNEEKEREFAILDLRNSVADESRKNAEQQLLLAQRTRSLTIVGAVLAVILVVLFFVIFYHRRKMASNQTTVRQYLDNLEAEKKLRQQLENIVASRPAETKGSAMSDDRQNELFNRLQDMMEKDQAFRNTELSLENTAERLGTNRTYLSQVVNEKAGLSFPVYVNTYRIKEAIRTLSDPDNDEPLKNVAINSGFASPSAFYSLFRQKTGMSPSSFRQNVKAMKKADYNYNMAT